MGIMWGIYIGSWLWSRARLRSVDSVAAFEKNLAVLERTLPAHARRQRLRAVASGERALGASDPILHRVPVTVAALSELDRMREMGWRVSMTLADARRRRRQVILSLLAAVAATAVPAVLWGGLFVLLHAGVVVLLFAYVGLLIRIQRISRERQEKVRYIAVRQSPQGTPAAAAGSVR